MTFLSCNQHKLILLSNHVPNVKYFKILEGKMLPGYLGFDIFLVQYVYIAPVCDVRHVRKLEKM